MTITGNFERFYYANFETNFLKNKKLVKNLKYRFLVEISTMKNAIFTYKTALSKANVKTNRMGSMTNRMGPITKSGVLQLTTLFF